MERQIVRLEVKLEMAEAENNVLRKLNVQLQHGKPFVQFYTVHVNYFPCPRYNVEAHRSVKPCHTKSHELAEVAACYYFVKILHVVHYDLVTFGSNKGQI